MSVRPPASTADEVLYSGPPAGLASVDAVANARYLFDRARVAHRAPPRTPSGWLRLRGRHPQQS